MISNSNRIGRAFLVLLAAAFLAAFAGSAFAAAAPVTVTVTVTGSPDPGATVTAKANVTINDGSTLQGVKWTQSGGVTATLSNTTTDTITAVLASRKVYREHLVEILEEPPANASGLPSYVPLPEPYEAGLQNRFDVVGMSPFSLEEAGHLAFDIAVTTTSGTHHATGAIATKLPWPMSLGIQNSPVNVPVMLHGKTQATYDWKITGPAGSNAAFTDATTQNPEFTPTVAGAYTITVTDIAAAKPVSIKVYAGTWKGVIIGQDANGRPQPDYDCRGCHGVGTPHDMFTPWAKSGHAEILTQNIVNPAGHYSEACVSCHAVGHNPATSNGGFDDAADYAGLVASGILTHGDASNWTKMLKDFPASARLSNIQCENCHGPNNSEAHYNGVKSDRNSLSSDVCGTCHGEPLRHGRFQQWQLSRHGNYETARAEGANPSCAKCHSAQGFIQWESKGFSNPVTITVDWTVDQVHPLTCATCHDPHAVGTTSGGPTTNATVRISGSTPMLDAGFKAENVGTAAICITCHNGRRGLKDDQHPVTDLSRAPHVGPQGDVLLGYNMYFTEVGIRGEHGKIADSCVTCHMEKTKPPADLSYNSGGTNHTFYASKTICSSCHTQIDGAAFQEEVEEQLEHLKHEIEVALKSGMTTALRAGNFVDLGTTRVKSASEISAVEFTEASGRQAVIVTLSTGARTSATGLNNVKVIPPAGTSVELLATMDQSVAKSGWNYFQIHSDKSKGIHNPPFVKAGLEIALYATKTVNANYASGGNAYLGGGAGNGTGAVTCTTPYVYWAEIAGHMPGLADSQWRTDLITRNLSSANASLKFVLHQSVGNLEGAGTIPAASQKAFEDVIATMGGTNNMGSLEICSDKPLLVRARIFNQAASGTFGQGFEGHVADLGYKAGQTVSLIGLRQKTGEYRTNIAISNSGKSDAEVSLSLFSENGTSLKTYNVIVPAGQVSQQGEPFKNQANQPDLGWGYATVTVVKGANVHVSASLIDTKTNDPTTIRAQQ